MPGQHSQVLLLLPWSIFPLTLSCLLKTSTTFSLSSLPADDLTSCASEKMGATGRNPTCSHCHLCLPTCTCNLAPAHVWMNVCICPHGEPSMRVHQMPVQQMCSLCLCRITAITKSKLCYSHLTKQKPHNPTCPASHHYPSAVSAKLPELGVTLTLLP